MREIVTLSKEQRIDIVNQIIKEISLRGRCFFYSKAKERLAYFVQGDRTLWYVDDYTGILIKMIKGQMQNDKGFSHGLYFMGISE